MYKTGPREPFKRDTAYLVTEATEGTGEVEGALVSRSLTLPSDPRWAGGISWFSCTPKKLHCNTQSFKQNSVASYLISKMQSLFSVLEVGLQLLAHRQHGRALLAFLLQLSFQVAQLLHDAAAFLLALLLLGLRVRKIGKYIGLLKCWKDQMGSPIKFNRIWEGPLQIV